MNYYLYLILALSLAACSSLKNSDLDDTVEPKECATKDKK